MERRKIFIEINFVCNGDYRVAEHCFCVVIIGSDIIKVFFDSENVIQNVFKFAAEIIVGDLRRLAGRL